MQVLIGTTNPAKLKFFQDALSEYDVDLITLNELGITAEPGETGRNPGENAAIKAAFYGQYADYVIGNDAGLYFDAIPLDDPRQPGLQRCSLSRLRGSGCTASVPHQTVCRGYGFCS